MEARHHVAVLSDIHADVRALRSIIDDATSRGIARIWNLGDFATGGPDPTACVDLCLDACEINLFGNHEFFITTQAWQRTSPPGPWILAAEFAYLELGGAEQDAREHLRLARNGVAPLPRNRIVDLLRLRPHAISRSRPSSSSTGTCWIPSTASCEARRYVRAWPARRRQSCSAATPTSLRASYKTRAKSDPSMSIGPLENRSP
jgi:hypothetical protein